MLKSAKLVMSRCAFGVTLCLLFANSFGFSFEPSEAEWAAWPEWCKVRYAQTVNYGLSAAAKFARRVPAGSIEKWESALGDAWSPLHHYCAGRAYLMRAARERDPLARNALYDHAVGESAYGYNRIPASHWMVAEIGTTMAQAHEKLGQTDQAVQLLKESISNHPKFTPAYAVLASIFRRARRLDDALEVLLQGNEAADGKSSEIHYFLGLTLVDMNRYDEAVIHARQAYALGYPLPGLKKKLSAVGKWNP